MSTCEAVRQNFELHIHYRTPAVKRLSFHLEYDQCICFKYGVCMPGIMDAYTGQVVYVHIVVLS